MKLLTLIFGIMLYSVLLNGFETQKEMEDLRKDAQWIVGKGVASDEMNADRMAVSDLLSQISVQVESAFESFAQQNGNNLTECSTSILKTYSKTHLSACVKRSFDKNGTYTVYRYLAVKDKERLFEERIGLLNDYLNRGIDAESELRIGDALLNYYWALILLRTHPNYLSVPTYVNGRNEILISFLPDRIRRIFSQLKFEISATQWLEEDDLTQVFLDAKYMNQPVNNLDIRYYKMNNWSDPLGVNNGYAVLEYKGKPQDQPRKIKLDVLYRYDHVANVNPEISAILESLNNPSFSESIFEFPVISKIVKNEPIIVTAVKDLDPQKYTNLIMSVFDKSGKCKIKPDVGLFTPEGLANFDAIMKNGNSRIAGKNYQLQVDQSQGKTTVRGLPVQLTFPQSNRSFNEELVFIFDANEKIEQILFSLTSRAIGDINKNLYATAEEKKELIRFVEQYKTAYCTKNLDFIQKVFNNNALIIIGKMIENPKANVESMYTRLGAREWEGVKYTKSQYINNLRRSFSNNEFINIRFEDCLLSRKNDPKSSIFGIQLHQYYYSQHYADEGYLFIMFDLADTTKPQIYVRTWQPEKNADGSIYGLEDFFLPSDSE